MKDYVVAAALGNGSFRRFIPLSRRVKGGFVAFHFLVIGLALNFPVMFAIGRLSPWEFYSRLYGTGFAAALDASGFGLSPDSGSGAVFPGDAAFPAGAAGETDVRNFNGVMYGNGYGRRVMLPALFFTFMLILIIQIVFYLLASVFLGLSRMGSSALSFRDRFGILVLSSTFPAVATALLGLWLPTVHLVVFYFAEIILAFAISRACDENGD
ncbi:MAG: hypothetical protein LBH15_07440 [Treponema sp.]|jgi:hypothetical protein|nr:hypothetical protein [Treponema sp.]